MWRESPGGEGSVGLPRPTGLRKAWQRPSPHLLYSVVWSAVETAGLSAPVWLLCLVMMQSRVGVLFCFFLLFFLWTLKVLFRKRHSLHICYLRIFFRGEYQDSVHPLKEFLSLVLAKNISLPDAFVNDWSIIRHSQEFWMWENGRKEQPRGMVRRAPQKREGQADVVVTWVLKTRERILSLLLCIMAATAVYLGQKLYILLKCK